MGDGYQDQTMNLSVIVVTYESRRYLPQCLGALEREMEKYSWEAIIVDNASRDGSSRVAQELLPEALVLRNSVNLGFGRAANQGIRCARGRFLLVLNPDVVVLPGAIDTMMDYMETNPRVGVVGPRLYLPDGSIQPTVRPFPRLPYLLFGRQSPLTRIFPHNPMSRSYLGMAEITEGPAQVDWMAGACMMMRREAFEIVGGFDRHMFLYVEDTDLCFRMAQQGWDVVYLTAARGIHYLGASTDHLGARAIVEHHRSLIRYFTKHMQICKPLRLLLRGSLIARLCWVMALYPLIGKRVRYVR